ncbi:MAG TPA: class I SAM-dependent methyltransferase [Methylomirabilota bacterium]|jgi:2-polyprenyl-3-methyl-5-hydroxy-6-metoxy-1,4-benzoquinol methylase
MLSGAETRERTGNQGIVRAVLNAVQWILDRTVSVAYGVVYDYIFERFGPYCALQREVLARVEASLTNGTPRADVRVLEVGCGPGNFSCILAEAGFAVVGIDPYVGLIDLAREKRRALRLSHLAFQHADLASGGVLWDGSFDQVVSIHSLYAHPEPRRLLAEVFRVLKPGGHLVIVNHTRRMAVGSTFAEVRRREGGLTAWKALLLWLVPNAIFEAARKPVGPHYWDEATFAQELRAVGFTVREMRHTFLNATSLLIWARKDGVAR